MAVYRTLLPAAPLGPLPRDGRPVRGLSEKVEEPEMGAPGGYCIAVELGG